MSNRIDSALVLDALPAVVWRRRSKAEALQLSAYTKQPREEPFMSMEIFAMLQPETVMNRMLIAAASRLSENPLTHYARTLDRPELIIAMPDSEEWPPVRLLSD